MALFVDGVIDPGGSDPFMWSLKALVFGWLQDLSQARTRWGADAADGFLSLFQTKLILNGIADTRSLEAISIALGEYDRDTVNHSLDRSDPQEWFSADTHSDTVSYQTQRQRILTPGEIARLPDGQGLLLQGADWQLLGLTPWHRSEPWKTAGTVASTVSPSRFEGICAERGVPFVSVIESLLASSVWMEQVAVRDGAHPGAEGNDALADLVLAGGWLDWLRTDAR